MALSDVLQFDCYTDNEIARNATKNFAEMLKKAFGQYQKLWNEYLKLRKHCEDADFKIPFHLLESDNYDQMSTSSDMSQLSSENTKMSTSLTKNVPTNCSSDNTSDLGDTVLTDSQSIQEQAQEVKLLKSPILVKRRSRSKRTNIGNDHCILDSSEENIMHTCLPMKRNISILTSNSAENILPVKSKENECSINENNNDKIECTPIAKIPKQLKVSKLYNVDTTLLQNGKKLKQSKLVLLPDDQSVDTLPYKRFKRSEPLRSHVSPTPEKDRRVSKKQNKSIEEEIIQSSPNKRMNSNLKIKNLKLKRKNTTKLVDRRENDIPDKFNYENSDNKLAVKEMHQHSLSQYFTPTCTSTQKDQAYLIKKSKTFGFDSENVENSCNILNSTCSQPLADIQHLRFETADDLLTPVKEIETSKINETIAQADKRKKYTESTSEILNNSTSVSNDETFCAVAEQLKKQSICDINASKDIENKMLPKFPPVKKNLINSFDIPPEKKEIYSEKISKKKSERAKVPAVSCYECKKYYENLGLSEEEIKTRKNQCSRHRTRYTERENTPEGFWDPIFPDTLSSTFQD